MIRTSPLQRLFPVRVCVCVWVSAKFRMLYQCVRLVGGYFQLRVCRCRAQQGVLRSLVYSHKGKRSGGRALSTRRRRHFRGCARAHGIAWQSRWRGSLCKASATWVTRTCRRRPSSARATRYAGCLILLCIRQRIGTQVMVATANGEPALLTAFVQQVYKPMGCLLCEHPA